MRMKTKLNRTQNSLRKPIRHAMIDLLNQQLADVLDLGLQAKQAHWNVKEPHFIGLHELFDKVAEELEEFTDDIAERAVELGGVALGTIQIVAKHSQLDAYPLMLGVATLYVAYKYWQRRSLLRELRMARIPVAELRQKLEASENPVILDLRSKAELERDPSVIQGAIHLVLDEVEARRNEFPHDRDIIVYCSCPNEATAAKVALLLQRSWIHTRPAFVARY